MTDEQAVQLHKLLNEYIEEAFQNGENAIDYTVEEVQIDIESSVPSEMLLEL